MGGAGRLGFHEDGGQAGYFWEVTGGNRKGCSSKEHVVEGHRGAGGPEVEAQSPGVSGPERGEPREWTLSWRAGGERWAPPSPDVCPSDHLPSVVTLLLMMSAECF